MDLPSVSSFNPRPREGGDKDTGEMYYVEPVSIHAPVKGATRLLLAGIGSFRSFNPRPREGGDILRPRIIMFAKVSIHAPVKGATALQSR